MPGRLRVCRIPLVKNREGHGKGRIAQILVKLRKLPRCQQSLVNDGLGRERREVTAGRHQRFRSLPQQHQTPLEPLPFLRSIRRRDEKLPDFRHRLERLAPQCIDVHGNAPPAQHAQPSGIRRYFDRSAKFRCCGTGKKCTPHAKMFGQADRELPRALAEELLGQRG